SLRPRCCSSSSPLLRALRSSPTRRSSDLGHINPAVTVGILVSGASSYAPGIPVTFANTIAYFVGEFVGAFLGAVLTWLAYREHRSEEHTSELQSRENLVCRLLLEKKKKST